MNDNAANADGISGVKHTAFPRNYPGQGRESALSPDGDDSCSDSAAYWRIRDELVEFGIKVCKRTVTPASQ